MNIVKIALKYGKQKDDYDQGKELDSVWRRKYPLNAFLENMKIETLVDRLHFL